MTEKKPQTVDRKRQLQEALDRLTTLGKQFDMNPNIKTYFAGGKLYYSYLVCGGYIGSIDTIHYHARYAEIVKEVEEQTAALVYHVIEHGNTIALLFVSDEESRWEEERPAATGVQALIVDVQTKEHQLGYIKLDCLQGALYRRENTVYPAMPAKGTEGAGSSSVDSEVVERLEILKNAGMLTDLDVSAVYTQEGELCCSLLKSVLGVRMGVVNRISAEPDCAQLLRQLSAQVSKKFYFVIGSIGAEVAFLYLSEDPEDWAQEKSDLETGKPYAVVVDPQKMTAEYRQIHYRVIKGGPLFIGK